MHFTGLLGLGVLELLFELPQIVQVYKKKPEDTKE
jgi:hypothetical protein